MTSSHHSRLTASAQKTTDFFLSRLQADGSSFGPDAKDIACYFKAPMLLITAGKRDAARQVLEYIKTHFLRDDGDFGTSETVKSVKPEYIEYWSYMNGWILRAANQLEMTAISKPAGAYLQQYTNFNTGRPADNDITDVLTAAHHGLLFLESGAIEKAIAAGNYLCRAMAHQPAPHQGFYLRMQADEKPVTAFPKEQSLFYFVSKTEPDQLHFMLGYPAAFLALLFQATKQKEFLAAAKQYTDFSLACHESVFASGFSHKTAWAASLLFAITGEEKYRAAAEKIAEYLLHQQSGNGLWYTEAGINTSLDQSAEIACWFLEISKNLSVEPRHEIKPKLSI